MVDCSLVVKLLRLDWVAVSLLFSLYLACSLIDHSVQFFFNDSVPSQLESGIKMYSVEIALECLAFPWAAT